MANFKGVTAAVMAVLSPTQWMTSREVTALLPARFRDVASTILSQRVIKGDVLRAGEHRAYHYKLVRAIAPVKQPSAEPVNESGGGVMPNQPPPMSASLGTVCRMTAPANKCEGTIEQALEAVLDMEKGLTLDEILVALPIGWSRTEALSALTDGVHGDWIASSNREGRTFYRLAGAVPEKRADPISIGVTAVTAVAIALPPVSVANFRERVDFMRMNLRDLLKDGCAEKDVPCVLLQHLAEAGTAIDNAYNKLA